MMKIFITLFTLVSLALSVEITASQNKAFVIDGVAEVTGYGVTQVVSSGEMTSYGENIAPTAPQKFYDIDIKDIQIELDAPDDIVKKDADKDIINTLKIPKNKFITMGVNG